MSIQLIMDNVAIPVKKIIFSDGSSSVKLEIPDGFIPSSYYSISVHPTTKADDYLWEIYLVQNAIIHAFENIVFNKRILHLPYLPHARADRVFEEGNALPLQIFLGNIVKNFSEIHLVDPHSDYYKCFNWVEFVVKYQHQCFIETVGNQIKSGDIIIAPDKGALNKIYKLQQALDCRIIATRVLEAGKKRDVETGKILETTLPDGIDLSGQVCWIVDDLVDGGGTFIPLALKLKEAGAKQVNLYVTHGIFAKGLDTLRGPIDNIYVYQTVGTYVNQIDINNFNKGII